MNSPEVQRAGPTPGPWAIKSHGVVVGGAFLFWRKAHALQKPVAALVPWTDYSPITIDENVRRWAVGSVHFHAGD